jgi:hypothetical protein
MLKVVSFWLDCPLYLLEVKLSFLTPLFFLPSECSTEISELVNKLSSKVDRNNTFLAVWCNCIMYKLLDFLLLKCNLVSINLECPSMIYMEG